MGTSLLSMTELADAAFDLLSSSTIGRYLRLARSAARRSEIRHHIEDGAKSVEDVSSRARSLWRELLDSPQRDVSEVELAVLLCVLAESAAEDLEDLLLACALSATPQASWISALAKRLLVAGAHNERIELYHAEDTDVRTKSEAQSNTSSDELGVNGHTFLYRSEGENSPPDMILA